MRPGWMLGAAALVSALAPLAADSELASLQQRLATLTGRRADLVRRLAAIEADPSAPLLLRSPVDIQDRAGKTIVLISKGEAGRGFTVFNESKQGVAGADGSMLLAHTATGRGGIRLSYDGTGPHLTLWSGSNMVASLSGDGFVAFSAATGKPTALLSGFRDAGFLSLMDVDGNGLVEAGMLSKRRNVGVVKVSPFIPRMEVLLPITPYGAPNFIRGYRPK